MKTQLNPIFVVTLVLNSFKLKFKRKTKSPDVNVVLRQLDYYVVSKT